MTDETPEARVDQDEEGREATDAENAALMLYLERTIPPMDIANAAKLLAEVKAVFDELGVVFFLRQGTCLGAYRDHALIEWDDDLDLGSIIDMHGFTLADTPSVLALASELRAEGKSLRASDSQLPEPRPADGHLPGLASGSELKLLFQR